MRVHGKEITTIVSDLDGTLLGEKKKLDPLVFSLIGELEKRGVTFVAASGRSYRNMQLLFGPIADRFPYICENGSMAVKKDQTLFQQCIPRKLALELLDDMDTIPEVETVVSSDRELYTLEERDAFVKEMNNFFRPEILAVKDYRKIAGGINKISIWWKGGIPEREERWFHERYDSRLHVTDSGNGWLDFTAAGASKGMALRELAKLEGFSLQETICFGDSENDITMFHECAVSYAMKTGREHVKAQAGYICEDVAKTLQGFLAADGS